MASGWCSGRRVHRGTMIEIRQVSAAICFASLAFTLVQSASANVSLPTAAQHIFSNEGATAAEHTDSSANMSGQPSPAFRTHKIVRPQLQHAHGKHLLQHTRQEDGSHAGEVTLRFQHAGAELMADLRLNHGLLTRGHFLQFQRSEGEGDEQLNEFNRTTVDLCHYTGTIRGRPRSRVAVSTCDGVRGILIDGPSTLHIEPAAAGSDDDTKITEKDHYLYSHADLLPRTSILRHNEFKSVSIAHRHKRSTNKAGASAGPFRSSFDRNGDFVYIELVLVVDKSMFMHLKTVKAAHEHCKHLTNIVNALYVPLNVSVALTGVVVWNKKDQIQIWSSSSSRTVDNFAKYRRDVLLRTRPNDHAQLLIGRPIAEVLGEANMAQMCNDDHSVGIVAEPLGKNGYTVASTMAHEMGHSLGMDHDDRKTCECTDRDDECIMTAASNDAKFHWSSCSADELRTFLDTDESSCLRNQPDHLFGPSTCGNGFVEPGEQCDCGHGAILCPKCCDRRTCQLRAGATCAAGACCDLRTCQPRKAGHECRGVDDGECDLPERCDGHSADCPADVWRRDTEPCAYGAAFCYGGACRPWDGQCREQWGAQAKWDRRCYAEFEDVCDMLRCRTSSSGKTLPNLDQTSWPEERSTNRKRSRPDRPARCERVKSSEVFTNGARCGAAHMCVDRRCRSLSSLLSKGIGQACAADCGERGACDNEGRCHCEAGWRGDRCDEEILAEQRVEESWTEQTVDESETDQLAEEEVVEEDEEGESSEEDSNSADDENDDEMEDNDDNDDEKDESEDEAEDEDDDKK